MPGTAGDRRAGLLIRSQNQDGVKVVMVPYFGTWMNNYAIMNGLVSSDKVDVTIDLTTSNDAQLLAGAYPIGAMSITGFATATEKSDIAFQAVGIYLADTGLDSSLGVDVVYTKADSKLTSLGPGRQESGGSRPSDCRRRNFPGAAQVRLRHRRKPDDAGGQPGSATDNASGQG